MALAASRHEKPTSRTIWQRTEAGAKVLTYHAIHWFISSYTSCNQILLAYAPRMGVLSKKEKELKTKVSTTRNLDLTDSNATTCDGAEHS